MALIWYRLFPFVTCFGCFGGSALLSSILLLPLLVDLLSLFLRKETFSITIIASFFAVSIAAVSTALSIFSFALRTAVSTVFLAICFSSSVNPSLASIAAFFAVATSVISCLAVSLDVPVVGTFSIACLPAAFALSTPAWSVALSIAAFAFSASVSTAFLAAAFSSEVKFAWPSIADFFASAAFVISCLVAVL